MYFEIKYAIDELKKSSVSNKIKSYFLIMEQQENTNKENSFRQKLCR